jgi:hypothetical protein
MQQLGKGVRLGAGGCSQQLCKGVAPQRPTLHLLALLQQQLLLLLLLLMAELKTMLL